MSNIAIITARGGSKRIPKKNIRLFLDKPIISYSIEVALKSGIFDEVMVSTDSQEIANVAIQHGAKVPFFRSEKNSGDLSTTADVIEEVLQGYQKQGMQFDYACCIYPTAPFITSERLTEAMKLIENSGADSIIPVTPFSYPIQRGVKIEKQDTIKMIWPENVNTRSQDLIQAYHDCGQFYFLNVEKFLMQKKLFTDNTKSIIVPQLEMHDIDNEEDWQIAEIKYKRLIEKGYEK